LIDKKSNSNLTNLSYSKYASELSSSRSEGYDLILYSKIGMGDGKQANNPWLQEFRGTIILLFQNLMLMKLA
jgi:molybdopterin-containing oxidoreductase family iron-sulfur binding subunit